MRERHLEQGLSVRNTHAVLRNIWRGRRVLCTAIKRRERSTAGIFSMILQRRR